MTRFISSYFLQKYYKSFNKANFCLFSGLLRRKRLAMTTVVDWIASGFALAMTTDG